MSANAALAESQPCVWMCAGLISYRLCSRGFDCENCPLDAALRGEMRERSRNMSLHKVSDTSVVPDDRFYTSGHTWLQQVGEVDHVWRFGVDAFAATILGNADAITWESVDNICSRGETLCTLDLGIGELPLTAPISGRVARTNDVLGEDATQVVTDPYYAGWILELESLSAGMPDELSGAAAAHHQTVLDLRRFRRTLAFHLLADVTSRTVRVSAEELLTDLRAVVGGSHYLELLREFVH